MKKLVLALLLALSGQAVLAGADTGSPRMNFMLHCSGCHNQDGSGNPHVGVPNMRERLGNFLKVKDGREFLVQVPGTSQSSLSHAATAELLNWLLVSFSPAQVPPGFVPYTTEEVARLRAHPLDDVPTRRNEVAMRMKELGLTVD